MSRCSGFPEAFVHAALFIALLTRFSAALLPVTEYLCANSLTGRNKVPDTPLPEQEPRPSSSCMLSVLRTVSFGGLYGRNPLSKSLFMAVSQDFWNRDAVFLSVLHCSHNRVQPNEQMVFPDLQVRFTSHFRYSKCGNSGKDANALRGPHSMYINQRLF